MRVRLAVVRTLASLTLDAMWDMMCFCVPLVRLWLSWTPLLVHWTHFARPRSDYSLRAVSQVGWGRP